MTEEYSATVPRREYDNLEAEYYDEAKKLTHVTAELDNLQEAHRKLLGEYSLHLYTADSHLLLNRNHDILHKNKTYMILATLFSIITVSQPIAPTTTLFFKSVSIA